MIKLICILIIGDIMKEISGKQNELEFVKYLNNKKISDLNILMLELLETLFKNVDYDSVVRAWLNPNPQKTDFFIKVNHDIRRISLKIGDKNSVHVEPISEFIHFLICNNIERDIIIKYLKYHYADGSTNGKGQTRLSVTEYKKDHQKEIDEINSAFVDEQFIKSAIYRFVLKGRNSNTEIDALIYGSIDDFFYLTKEDIINLIFSKKNNYATGVHIGPLFIQPQSRNLQNKLGYENCRYSVQVKWFNLCDHIIEYKNDLLK